MALYLIGLGLYDEKDVTVRGFEIIQKCDTVYLEHYTSILGVEKSTLESFYKKEILLAPRDLVEKEAEEKLLLPAREKNIALLIVGDVFGATTHTDLHMRAKELGVQVECVFNASVMNAVGIIGLELYKYGKATSIVFPDHGWLPETPYEVIQQNKKQGLHTLCLLDIKVAELSREDMLKEARGESVKAQPPRYMTVREGLDVLLRIEEKQKKGVLKEETQVVGIARIGHPDMKVCVGTVKQVMECNFGSPLQCIVIPGSLQVVEEEALLSW